MRGAGLKLQRETGRDGRVGGRFDSNGAGNENFAAHAGIANAQLRPSRLEQENSCRAFRAARAAPPLQFSRGGFDGYFAGRIERVKAHAQVLCARRTSRQDKQQKDQMAREPRSEEHTSELQSHLNLVCRLLLEKKKDRNTSRGGACD